MLEPDDVSTAEGHPIDSTSPTSPCVPTMGSVSSTTPSSSTGEIEREEVTPLELTDVTVCRQFMEQTCGCKKIKGGPCSSQFPLEYYIERRAQASLLTRGELDLVMLGSAMCTTRMDDVAHGRHKTVSRKRPRAHYMHNGLEVCKVTFGFIFGVGKKHKINSIRQHYMEEGLTIKVHKNSQLQPHNALGYDDIKSISSFLLNYSEQHAILLPGRIPGYKRDDMKLLPSSNSKKVNY